MKLLRRLRWFARNIRAYRLVAISESGVHVFDVNDEGVRGVVVDGAGADVLRDSINAEYAGRNWDSASGKWLH